jgi:hypothetical protein
MLNNTENSDILKSSQTVFGVYGWCLPACLECKKEWIETRLICFYMLQEIVFVDCFYLKYHITQILFDV